MEQIKNGFKLNYTLTKQDKFKKNEILLATDGDKEKLIVLERALDTTKKWNLKHAMGDKFNAF